MRLVKSPGEVAALRRAVEVSALGHVARDADHAARAAASSSSRPRSSTCSSGAARRRPATRRSSAPAPNACVLHYVANRGVHGGRRPRAGRRRGRGRLLHGRHHPHVAGLRPVHRPSSGRSTTSCCARSEEVIALVKPGLEWHKLHENAVKVLTEGLVDLGVLAGPVEKAIEEKTFRKFYMHGTGHWLGHRRPRRRAPTRGTGAPGGPLEPGMVFTVEPGLYFHPDEPRRARPLPRDRRADRGRRARDGHRVARSSPAGRPRPSRRSSAWWGRRSGPERARPPVPGSARAGRLRDVGRCGRCGRGSPTGNRRTGSRSPTPPCTFHP